MDANAIVGFIGAFMILIAFIYNQKGVWQDDYLVYDLSNFIGSLFLIWYSYLIGAYPFILLYTVWTGLSLHDVIKALHTKKGQKMESLMKGTEK